jgi:putative ABC transport system permease protein
MLADNKAAAFIAYKSVVKGSKSTLLLLIFILSLSFLNMMFITGIMKGFTEGMLDFVIKNMSSHVAIGPQEDPSRKEFIENQYEIRKRVETIPGVLATTRRYQMGGSIGFDKEKDGTMRYVSGAIVGIDPDDDKKIFTVHEYLTEGEWLDGLQNDEIVLGADLAGGYDIPTSGDLGGVKPGDKVRITYSNGLMRTYTVKGIFNLMDLGMAFVSSREAESVLSVYNNASSIFIKADLERDSVENYAARIQEMVPSLKVQGYTELMGSFESFVTAFDMISYIVSVISVVVAAITIFVLIYVNAVSKRRQIGILKAIGVKESIIVKSYVLQSLFYAICGITVGLFFVFLVLYPLLNAYPITMAVIFLVKLYYTPIMVIVAVGSLLAAGLLAGYLPARIVARRKILDAIWG